MKSSDALVKLSLTFIVILTTGTREYRSENKLHHNAYNIESQPVVSARFLQDQKKFNRFQHGTKPSTKRGMLGSQQLLSIDVEGVKNDQQQSVGKFPHNSNNDLKRITDRDLKVTSNLKNVSFKLQQKRSKYVKRVRKGVESGKLNLTEEDVQCEIPSLSCHNCCDNSNNCTHKPPFCRCDTQCTFYDDCCVDYETFCGKKQTNSFGVDPQVLSCTKPTHIDMKSESDMVWIINKCPWDRKSDEISLKCENADEMELNISSLQNLLPVIVTENNLIFRNEFCAKCNGMAQFDYFGFDISCYVVPPSSITSFAELVEFASRYCEPQEGIYVFRDDYQPVRECSQYFRHLCPTWKELNKKCNHSTNNDNISKTRWCDLILSKWDNKEEDRHRGIGGLGMGRLKFVSLIAVLRFQAGPSVSQVQKTLCHGGTFYDDYLETCRNGESIPLLKDNLDKYYVAVWLDVSGVEFLQPSRDEIVFTFAKLFNFQRSQVNDLRINLDVSSVDLTLWIIDFELSLTNEQTLLLAKANYTTTNNTVSQINNDPRNLKNGLSLQRLLFFSRKFNITISNKTYTVLKTTSRQLACIRKRTFPQGTYILTQNEKYYYINSTGESFARKQVFFEEMNISICEQIVFAACDGQRVNLTLEEYVKFDNLSIFYNRTKTIYHFGAYDIEDGDIFMCIPESLSKKFVPNPSSSVLIQTYLTVICFVLSLTGLFLVIQTYLIFSELRNLHGKNLLSLSVSLFLAQLLWLVPDPYYTTILCHVIAAIKHYVFLVSFVAMATIAWHTHSVFASKVVRQDLSKYHECQKFYKYSAIVWGAPAMFVVACVGIDRNNVCAIYVNELWCWFDNEPVQQYVFVLPVGLLLLFNVIFFTLTVFRIQRNRSSTRLVHSDQKRRKIFWIYLKLSALMGFSWLFGLIDLFAKSVQVFSYLFVIFASLQGVYIALAFIAKRTIWEKYKRLMRRKCVKKFKPDYQSTLLEALNKSRETKV